MRNKTLRWASLILGLLVTGAVSAKQPFSAIFVFGDSLSDTGNLASLPGFGFLTRPPFDRGYSNGPRAVEVLAKNLGLMVAPSLQSGTNFAFAGARARNVPDSIPDLEEQVTAFLLDHQGVAPPDALYIVFIGASDVRDARDAPNEGIANHIILDAVNALDINIRTLAISGAKAILVINSPDIGAIPETRLLAEHNHNPKLIRQATRDTQKFNRKLSKRLQQIDHELGLDHLIEFDLFSFFRFITQQYLALGFTDNKDACFSDETFTFNPDCNAGVIDQFVFFDEIHSTERIHERAGSALFAVVPEFTP